jgi:hypothetical protein
VHRLEHRRQLVIGQLLEQLGVEPFDLHLDPVGQAAMHQGLVQRLVGILQADIFADHTDRHLALGMLVAFHDIDPARQVRFAGVGDAECAQNLAVQPFAVILHGHRIDALGIERGDHRFLADVAELRDLRPLGFGQRMLAAAQQDIGLNAERGQLAHAVLGGLGLQLARRRDIGHQGDVDEQRVLAADLVAQLADRLDERQRFDIADGAADFAQHEIEIVGIGLREFLDRVGDVRDHLHGRAQIIAAPLALDDRLVNPARGDIVRLARRNAGEALVMAQIEIGLGTVIGDVHLAVLIGRHRARIDVEIGVELADAHAVTACLQQSAQACGHQALAERGNHAAGDENITRHGRNPLAVRAQD